MISLLVTSIPLDNAAAAADIAAQWEISFNELFTNGLFQVIASTCLGLALLFLCFSVIQGVTEWEKTNSDSAATSIFIKKIITSLFLIILLMDGGSMIVTGIKGFRAISNAIDNQILTKLSATQNINDRIANIRGQQSLLKDIQTKAQTCKVASDPLVAKQCATELNAQIIDAQGSGKITDDKSLNAMNAYTANLAAATATADPIAVMTALEKPLNDAIGSVVSDAVTSIFSYVLGLLTSAVQTMTELCFMLTSLVTPIFITAGLLPGGIRSIIAILTSFWAVALYKICYIIIAGLASEIIKGDTSAEALQLGIITGVLAPILAGILAAGGGMGFAKAAASAAGSAASAASGAIIKVSSGGIF